MLTGTVIALITMLAYAQSSLTVSDFDDPRKISAAMWRSAARQADIDVRDQLLRLGIFAAVAAIAFGVIAWKTRHGTRRPTLLLAGAAVLTAVCVPLLWQDFLTQASTFLDVTDGEQPYFIHVTQPGWYFPLRSVLLVAGAVAQVCGLVLLTGRHGVSWLARHQKKQPFEQEIPPLWANPPRQAMTLMLLTPVFLLIYAGVNYAGVNYVGCCFDGLDSLPKPFLHDMRVHLQYLAIPAVPVVVGGLILHLTHGRGRLWAGLTAGILGLPYIAALLESALHYSDTSMFHEQVAESIETPWWNMPAIATAGIAILLLHLASLAALFRNPRTLKLTTLPVGSESPLEAGIRHEHGREDPNPEPSDP
ncbi:hypothetical protein ABT294_07340 [Nonomuraea sp. NPDC000554]|uniref:hypothetical protein n=1 Tax=Nonomuraea sp. NPDC000554 TaxID=3154259 RepID=UPI003316B218